MKLSEFVLDELSQAYEEMGELPRRGDQWYLQRIYDEVRYGEETRWWNGCPTEEAMDDIEVLAFAVIRKGGTK